MKHPVSYWLFMFLKLPSIVFWGIKVKELDPKKCEISIPFTWRTQNPFRSIYFAALAGAAELSTGALCMLHLAGSKNYSMLVTGLQAEFLKKADQKIIFSCDQGEAIRNTINKMIKPGFSETIILIAKGCNTSGEAVARFHITWSFKRKA